MESDESWKKRASCRDAISHSSEDMFFAPKGRQDLVQKAKALCRSCPVVKECKEYSEMVGAKYGIWAGETKKR